MRAPDLHSNLALGFLHPLAVHVAVFPEAQKPLIVLARLLHLPALLVNLSQEVEASDIRNRPRDVLGRAFGDALEPLAGTPPYLFRRWHGVAVVEQELHAPNA